MVVRARKVEGAPPSVDLEGADVETLRRSLVEWYAREKRELPWRTDRDAYRVWISEAMLQQTRVETVVPYFARFLARFPDVASLARAELDDVLAAWSGLGYYRRARTLHAAARAIVERHAGVFPTRRDDVLALPGVGPYTAGAVLSIAFDAPEPLVDGNVARVFARAFAIEGDPSSRAFQERAWTIAAALVPRDGGAGDWNQALMELGALVCVPREPDCARCPWRTRCRALAEDRVGALPHAKARPATRAVELAMLVDEDARGLVLERRPDEGRMAGMWQLPTIETSGATLIAPSAWPAGARVELDEPIATVAHSITSHRIRAIVRRGRALELAAAWERVPRADVDARALTGMTRKALRAVASSRATPEFPFDPLPERALQGRAARGRPA